MNKEELEDLLKEVLADVAPNFYLDEDDRGQVIICLNLVEDGDEGELVPLEDDEDDDEEEDEELLPLDLGDDD